MALWRRLDGWLRGSITCPPSCLITTGLPQTVKAPLSNSAALIQYCGPGRAKTGAGSAIRVLITYPDAKDDGDGRPSHLHLS